MGKPGSKQLTPVQVAKAWSLYLQHGSFCEVARLMGRAESTIRSAINRQLASVASRREVYALALEQEERDQMTAVGEVRHTATRALKTATTPEAIKTLAGVVHEGTKVTSLMRLNNAKLNGTLIDKTQTSVTVNTPLTIYSPEEQEPE